MIANDCARGSALSYPQRGALVYGAVLAPLADQLLAQSKLIFLSFIPKFYFKYLQIKALNSASFIENVKPKKIITLATS